MDEKMEQQPTLRSKGGSRQAEPIYMIRDLEQVRVLANPLRLRIIELLKEPMTTRQVAKLLQDKPSNLYYHMEELERVRLIRLVETKLKGNIMEKYYQSIARDFAIDRGLFKLEKEAFPEMIGGILDTTLLEVTKSVRSKVLNPASKEGHITIHKHVRGSKEEIEGLYNQIRSLLRQCEELSEAGSSKPKSEFCLTLLFYPTQKAPKQSQDSSCRKGGELKHISKGRWQGKGEQENQL